MKLGYLVVLTLAAVGCDEKPNSSTTPTPSASVSASAAPVASAVPTATAAPSATTATNTVAIDLPLEDDFLDEAEKEVTKDNMEAELAKIEKDLVATK